MSHESEQYLTNPKPRLLYQSWGSNTLTPPFQQFSCPHASCPVTPPFVLPSRLSEVVLVSWVVELWDVLVPS